MLKRFLINLFPALMITSLVVSCGMRNNPLGFFALSDAQVYIKSNTIKPSAHQSVYFEIQPINMLSLQSQEKLGILDSLSIDLAGEIAYKLDQKLAKYFSISLEKEKILINILPLNKKDSYEITKNWVESVIKRLGKNEKIAQKSLDQDLEQLFNKGCCIEILFQSQSGALLEKQVLLIHPWTKIKSKHSDDAVQVIVNFCRENFH